MDRLRRLDVLFGQRFWGKVAFAAPDECWLWTACKNERGYGQFWNGKRMVHAHRVAFVQEYGQIPLGCEIDHKCRNRACVNPTHLRAVSHRENVLCGESFSAANAAKQSCANGHPFDDANTIYRSGRRDCLRCRRDRGLRWWRKRHPAEALVLACLRAVGVSEEELDATD